MREMWSTCSPAASFFFPFWHLSKLTGVPTINYAALLRTGKDIINAPKYKKKKIGKVERN